MIVEYYLENGYRMIGVAYATNWHLDI